MKTQACYQQCEPIFKHTNAKRQHQHVSLLTDNAHLRLQAKL